MNILTKVFGTNTDLSLQIKNNWAAKYPTNHTKNRYSTNIDSFLITIF